MGQGKQCVLRARSSIANFEKLSLQVLKSFRHCSTNEVKSDTLPLQQPAGAADAILVYPQTSEDVVQISSSCGEEALPNVRGDSSPTANTAMLPEEDPVSRLDVLEIGLRYFT
jgi:hypothetical protein